jgi:ligand-binding SRPBCC domain-containing protein
MPMIVVETRIAAPIERCFDLARDVDAHAQTSDFTNERLVGGRTSGLLQLGDTVTFEAVHLGLRRRLTARIVELDPPHRFVDEMMAGPFAQLRHVHEFRREAGHVLMIDTLAWRTPLGILGRLADLLFVERHLRAYLTRKQANLKAHAEAESRRSA